ncbi:MAG TPA: LysM peptidoglycan-binding domain-containing protein [Ktedonobacterales bacterium]|nr:LysM peptidoglycan-binding domain-containing protein [Ktedonobacterales bacterium]
MRSVPAPVRCADEWESDEWTSRVLASDWEEFAGGDGDDDDVQAVWRDTAECIEPDDQSPYGALLAPEHADSLDFTAFLPIFEAPRPHRPRAVAPAPVAPRRVAPTFSGRVARASVRLVDLGKMRPVVRIPATAAKKASPGKTRATKETRLPPIWLLANLCILLVAGLAVLPHVVQVDAAAGCDWYTVRPGDTLGNLGWAHHTNALTIAKANQIANPNLIYVGQRICIPLTQSAHAPSAPTVPATTQPPRFGSAAGVQSFVQFALPYARQAHNATGWPTSMILAQWGLEQGWRIPGYTGFNWGNVAALPGEPTVNGIAVPGSPAAFAYARTPDQGLSYYIRVAHLSFYNGVARAAQNGGPDAAARALGASPWDAGHYTATGSPGSSLLSILRVYNLYYYDSH